MNHRSSNIFHFVSETGTNQQVAQSLLEEHGWNVVQAVKSYQCRQMGLKSGEPESVVGLPPPSDGALNQSLPPLLNGGEGSSGGMRKESMDHLEREDPETNEVNCHQQRLKRGMSNTMNNAHIVSIAHDLVLNGIKETGASVSGSGASTTTNCQKDEVMDTLSCTFILPDINHYPPEFRAFLHKDLIETSTLISLEQAGRLNWWADLGVCQRLLPLATTGDGNCLLHAASLGIWGFHDRRLTLRKALCHTLNESSARDAFQRRWRFQQNQINKQSGLIYSEQEWGQEWDNLLKLASPQPRKNGLNSSDSKDVIDGDAEVFYESLEELHVFVLAHVLCRPIIIVADTILKDSNGDALAPISFGGIYLPMECDPIDCYPTPLLLTYDAAHFSAIVPMEHCPSPDALPPLAAAIPVVDPDFNLLPIHFAVDPGEGYSWDKDGCGELLSESSRLDLLRRYLNLESLSVRGADSEEARNQLGRAKAGSCSDLVQSPSIECEDMSQVSLTVPKAIERRPGSVRGKRAGGATTGVGGAEEESGGGAERARVLPRSMQNMVRSFGSLGRSFRNRIKNMAKTGKQTEGQTTTKAKTGEVGRKGTGRKTGTTSTSAVDHDRILCARLQHRRQAFQEDMVRNYLQTALEKFERERKAFCSSMEHGEHSSSSSGWVERAVCVNSNCQGVASASTSYLCQSCFERQRQDEMGVTGGSKCPPLSNASSSSVDGGRPTTMVDQVVVGIDRVESGPVLPRYVSPQLVLPPAAKTSSISRSSVSSSTTSPRPPSSSSAQTLRSHSPSSAATPVLTTTVNGSTRSGAGHADLTLYREGPPLNQNHWNAPGPSVSSTKTTEPLTKGQAVDRPEDPLTRDRSSPRNRSSVQTTEDDVFPRRQVDARKFEKELERSLEDLQKSVLINRVPPSMDAPSRMTGSSKSSTLLQDGLKAARFHAPVAVAGPVDCHGNGGSHGNGFICSNGPHRN